MQSLIVHFSYFGVVAVLLASGFGLPLPEDLPLLLGGYLCANGTARLDIMLPLVLVAVLGADCMVYVLGRVYGPAIQRMPWLQRMVGAKRLLKARTAFCAHSGKTLLCARFLPGMRTPTYFAAGAFHVPFWKMLVFDGVAAVVSVPLLVLVGYYLADHFDRAIAWARTGQIGTALVVVLVAAAFLAGRWLGRRRQARIDAGDTRQARTPGSLSASDLAAQANRRAG